MNDLHFIKFIVCNFIYTISLNNNEVLWSNYWCLW